MASSEIITGTGFHGASRIEVRAAAEACGASYSGDLQKGVTTRLVVKEAHTDRENLSSKVLRALEWGIPVTGWEWLRESAIARELLPVHKHLLFPQDGTAGCDTPPCDKAALCQDVHPQGNSNRYSCHDTSRISPVHDTVHGTVRDARRCSEDVSADAPEDEGNSSDRTCSLPVSPTSSTESVSPRQQSAPCATALRDLTDSRSVSEAAPSQQRVTIADEFSSSEDDVECAQRSPGSPPAPRSLARLRLALPSPSPPPDAAAGSPIPARPSVPFGSPLSQSAALCKGSSAAPLTVSPASSAMHPKKLRDDFLESLDCISPPTNASTLASRSNTVVGSAVSGARLAPVADDGSIVVIKAASRQRRGSTLAEFHVLNRKQLQSVNFAESVQVVTRGFVLNCKDRRTAVVIQPKALPLQPQATPVAAELKSVYRLPEGSWWAEYLPFFSAADIAVLAQQSGGSKVPLPDDFEESNERLRGIYCLHCPLLDISGTRTIRHSKTTGRVKSNSGLFWRSCFDTDLLRCVTDKPVSTFLS